MHLSVADAREALRRLPRPVGFVPTMGSLHAGHLSLVAAARARCAAVAVSLFVNPMQFAPGEDYERYPRDLTADTAQLADAGADVLFAPDTATLYPVGFSTIVDVGDLGTVYEGIVRPTHFRGVTTIVAKLLNVVQPEVLFVGQKDAQQSVVLRKMVADLNVPVEVVTVPTVREPDGLALSSRNAYLTPKERATAPSLHAALQLMLDELRAGRDAIAARERAKRALQPPGEWNYLDLVDARTFAPLEQIRAPAFVIGAARFGVARLIDNLWVTS